MKTITCPKCKKGVINRIRTPDKPYWNCICRWCGNNFRHKKTWAYVKSKEEK